MSILQELPVQVQHTPIDKNADDFAQTPQAFNQPAGETPVIPLPKERHITVRRKPGLSANNEVFPYIAFGGRFLKEYGFYLGKSITVRMEANKITISVDDPGEGPVQKAMEESVIRRIMSYREIQYRLILTQNYLYEHTNNQTDQK